MLEVIALLIIAGVTLLIGRLGTIALTATGLPRPIAKFQARSALSGAGYTTNESESIVAHPARRRIVMTLMTIGGLGSAAIIATLIISFVNVDSYLGGFRRGVMLVSGLFAFWLVLRVPTLDRLLARAFAGVIKNMTDVDVRNYANMLRLSSDYGITELHIEPDDWLAERSLQDLDLSHEGLLVLGIVRGDHYFGAPKGTYKARPGDILLIYGHVERLTELDEREAGAQGEAAHREAIATQRQIEQQERIAEAAKTGDSPNLEGAEINPAADVDGTSEMTGQAETGQPPGDERPG